MSVVLSNAPRPEAIAALLLDSVLQVGSHPFKSVPLEFGNTGLRESQLFADVFREQSFEKDALDDVGLPRFERR